LCNNNNNKERKGQKMNKHEAFDLAVALYLEQNELYASLPAGVYTSPAIEELEERLWDAIQLADTVESAIYDHCYSEGLLG
jgi:hypothetical protein